MKSMSRKLSGWVFAAGLDNCSARVSSKFCGGQMMWEPWIWAVDDQSDLFPVRDALAEGQEQSSKTQTLGLPSPRWEARLITPISGAGWH